MKLVCRPGLLSVVGGIVPASGRGVFRAGLGAARRALEFVKGNRAGYPVTAMRWAGAFILLAGTAACSLAEPTQDITTTPAPFRLGDPTATPLGEDITDPDYVAGKEAYWAGEYEAVLVFMEAVLERNPDLAPPHWYRGMAFWNLDECVSGLAEMELALELNPRYALAVADRGLMHECLGNEGQALVDYQYALALDPTLAKVHQRLGAYYFNRGDYERSFKEHTIAVEIDPSRAGAWVDRAEALRFLLRYEECIESASEALRIDPEQWRALLARGLCAFEMGALERGISDYERYLAEVPDDPTAWYDLGIGYRRTGELDAAIKAYTRALLLDPSFAQALINRGSAFIDLGRFDEAVTDYSKALRVGEIPAAYNGRGDAYVGLGRYEEARADFEHSIELFPFSTYAYCRLVPVYFQLERYRDTIRAAQEAARVAPECANDQGLLELQGRAYYGLEQYGPAIEYMSRALEQGTYVMGYYYRGIAHDDAGQWHEAIRDLESFVDLATLQGVAHEERVDAEARLTRLSTAAPTPGALSGVLAQSTPISPDGYGPLTIDPGQAIVLSIVPSPPITIEMVTNAFLYFLDVSGVGSDGVDLVFSVWHYDYGEWSDNQGQNEIPQGSSAIGLIDPMAVVDLHGEVIIEIRNRASGVVTVEGLQMTMLVQTTDGRTVEVGAIPGGP